MAKKKDPKELIPKHLKKSGRPSKYTPEMVELICERVATHDCGLSRLTEMYDDMPDRVNINIWRRKYPEFQFRATHRPNANNLNLSPKISWK